MGPNFNVLNTNAPAQTMLSFEQGRQNALEFNNQQEDRQIRNALAQAQAQRADVQARQMTQRNGIELIPRIAQLLYANPSDETVDMLGSAYSQATGKDVSQLVGQLKQMPLEQRQKIALAMGQKADPGFKVDTISGKIVSSKADPITGKITVSDTYDPGISRLDQAKIDAKNQDEEIPPMSEGALDNAAARYNVDGTLPTLGAGKEAARTRTRILERAAGMTQGQDPFQVRLNQLSGKADSASLNALTKSADVIGSFENNFKGALSLVMPLMEQVNNGRFPGINKVSQLISYQGGDPTIKAALNQLTTAMMDYQKLVTAGSNITSAELSIGAQKRAEELLSMADNPETFKRSIDVMRQDADIKSKSILEAKSKVEERLKGRGNPNNNAPATQAPKGATHSGINPATGQMEYFDAKGNKL